VNSTVSYYLKGGLVALAFDLEVRRRTGGERSIGDVLRRLWERYGEAPRGYDDAAIQGELEAATGIELGDFFDRHVRGREDPDLAAALAGVGLELRPAWDPAPSEPDRPRVWLGIACVDRGLVQAVLDGGPGADGGVSPGDEIIAIDGYRVTGEPDLRQRLAARAPGDRVEIALFRRGRLRTVAVTLDAAPHNRYEIAGVEQPDELGRRLFEQWMGEPHPGAALRAAATIGAWS
jgi:predicted metalloprotease with PDZ domain